MQCKLVNLQTTCANQSHHLIDNTGQKRTTHSFPLLKMKHNFLRNSFFPSLRLCLIGKAYLNIRKIGNILAEKILLKVIHPPVNNNFGCNNHNGTKFIT